MSMADLSELDAPRPIQFVELTDAFCDVHFNAEYKQICREMAAVVCRSAPSALRGKSNGWAAGIVQALGRVNFLTDPSQTPHMAAAEIAKGFGVSQATMMSKAGVIREGLDLVPFHPDWYVPGRLEDNPLVWMLEVNGFVMDIRMAPREAQIAAYEIGLIPYVPAEQ
jgi:hypothetical protein